jgi:hypothetical protein
MNQNAVIGPMHEARNLKKEMFVPRDKQLTQRRYLKATANFSIFGLGEAPRA